MKKHVILLGLMALLTALFMTVSVSAAEVASGECGENLTWTLDDAGLLTVSGKGAMEDYPEWDGHIWDITAVKLSSGVTSVGAYAFQGGSAITSVEFPTTLTAIGDAAFSGCAGLTSVKFPYGLKSVGTDAFLNCTGLTSAVLPSTVTSLGKGVFACCAELRSAALACNITEVPEGTFSNCVNLESVTLPANITSIGWSAFYHTSLTSLTLPETLTTIGNAAFTSCNNLVTVDLPDSVTSVGSDAFWACSKLTTVHLPDGITAIESDVFAACRKLANINVPDGLTTLEYRAIDINEFGSALKTVSLPASLKSIGSYSLPSFPLTIYYAGSKAQWVEAGLPDWNGSGTYTVCYNAPHICENPKDVTTTADGSAKFTVKSCGASNLTYQWQYSTDGGETWTNNGGKKATFTISTAGEYRNGYQYRCLVTRGNVTTPSAPATLTVAPVVVTAQPEHVTAPADGTASFSVSAAGNSLKYQWQFSKDGGLTWLNNTCTTKTFTINAPGKSRDGYLYRCKVIGTNGEAFSEPAMLAVTAAKAVTKPTITAQPKKVSAGPDDTVSFSVTATGGSLSYQWQYKAPGKGWVNNTCKTATFTINGPQAWRDGYQYRCKVTNSAGTVTSKAAILTVTTAQEELKITAQPVDAEVKAADKVSFSVKATGTGLTYQWQYKAPGKGWVNNSCTKATLTFDPAKLMRDGYRYRCVITDVDGNVLISSVAALTVN